MLRKLPGPVVAAATATAGLTLVTPARASAAIATGWNASAESAHQPCVHRPGHGDQRRLLGIDFVKSLIDKTGQRAECRGNRAELPEGLSRKLRHLTVGECAIGILRQGRGCQESILQKSHCFGTVP